MIIRQAVHGAARATLCVADEIRRPGTSKNPANEAETKDKEEQSRSGHKLNIAPLDQNWLNSVENNTQNSDGPRSNGDSIQAHRRDDCCRFISNLRPSWD